MMKGIGLIAILGIVGPAGLFAAEVDGNVFRDEVAPILESHCLRCHQGKSAKGDLDLSNRSGVFNSQAIVAGKPDESRLFEVISGDKPSMPKSGDRLDAKKVEIIRSWIAQGADWPVGFVLKFDPTDWWSLRPLTQPPVPDLGLASVGTSIDSFILAKLKTKGLTPSPQADRRTLIRRVTFDLIGLPPSIAEIDEFLSDPRADAYERLVDRLLASPRYGERWARHWLDVIRYADTHGYDKDQPRLNAWPYRDYVIRAFNEDKPYARFVEEQLAGDILYPGTRDGIEALGFISAGPWDFIGHAEVPETKLDGQVARLLDRDDMVSNTLNSFASLTVQCARCHDHKFDPVTQDDYYSLQAVFAALDRADRLYDPDPEVARRRTELATRRREVTHRIDTLLTDARGRAGAALAGLEHRINELEAARKHRPARSPAYGYHSGLAANPDSIRWVQIDLGQPAAIDKVILHATEDDFNAIGPGFGFPVRFKIEASNDPRFDNSVALIADKTADDFTKPRLSPVGFDSQGLTARFVRVTATRLALRQNDYNFALAEVEILDPAGKNLARSAQVSALDTIEAPPRWRLANLIDGDYPAPETDELATIQASREALILGSLHDPDRQRLDESKRLLTQIDRQFGELPPQAKVYTGTVHHGAGAFRGTGADGGKPRLIRVLARGDLRSPRQVVGPGTVPIIAGVPARFELSADAPEGERRAALARWLTDRRNPLTWRSIVNRVWQYHFGRGLVDSPNDFGRMGQFPTHPELLDWLASDFRDGGQSIKRLQRLIVTSAVYRQTSSVDEARAKLDGDNLYLWRMNRRRLEAEAIRDSVLMIAGKLDLTMGGPGFHDFVIERPEHSPHYQYQRFDPADSQAYRRSIYRFIVRSQPQPFLTALDCADPAMSVDKRNESTTALQALALLNDQMMVRMASELAARMERENGELPARIDRVFLLAVGRLPQPPERAALVAHASKFGLANACRVIFNLNEFVFVD